MIDWDKNYFDRMTGRKVRYIDDIKMIFTEKFGKPKSVF